MTELKTLKDIENKVPLGKDILRVSSYDLKQEAIKWVKDRESKMLTSARGGIKYNNWAITGQIEFIKIFFNLTPEDLK